MFKQNQIISISSGLIEFWCFGLPAALGVGGWMDEVGVAPHTCAHACAHMHTHTCTHAHVKHDNFMQMATPIGGIPGNSL